MKKAEQSRQISRWYFSDAGIFDSTPVSEPSAIKETASLQVRSQVLGLPVPFLFIAMGIANEAKSVVLVIVSTGEAASRFQPARRFFSGPCDRGNPYHYSRTCQRAEHPRPAGIEEMGDSRNHQLFILR